jgi:hypothetical protein
MIVALFVIALSAYLILTLKFPINLAVMWNDMVRDERQNHLAEIPDQNAGPKEVLELRQRHHLRSLTESEDGRRIQDLPNGVYGFSMCDVQSLSAKRDKTFPLEIHKREDGIVYYVGYTSENNLERYLTRQKNFHLLTSPNPLKRASLLFEIPVDFVSKCERRLIEEGSLFDLFVTVIPEYRD